LSTFECHLDDIRSQLQRRSERNTTEGSIHGNAKTAPKKPMG
jgi:hypothetical protein